MAAATRGFRRSSAARTSLALVNLCGALLLASSSAAAENVVGVAAAAAQRGVPSAELEARLLFSAEPDATGHLGPISSTDDTGTPPPVGRAPRQRPGGQGRLDTSRRAPHDDDNAGGGGGTQPDDEPHVQKDAHREGEQATVPTRQPPVGGKATQSRTERKQPRRRRGAQRRRTGRADKGSAAARVARRRTASKARRAKFHTTVDGRTTERETFGIRAANPQDGSFVPAPQAELEAPSQVIHLPMTWANGVAVVVILGLAILGSVYIYKICTQPTCMCPLCDGDYVVKASLGSGGFGSVFRVTRREDQRDFVLKKIPVADLNDASDAHTEARELRFLQHPRIVGYEDDFLHTTPQSAVRDAHVHVCIIMELCERDLRQQLEDKRGAGAMFSEEQLLKYLAQICSALSYCHGKFIIHRDIKPQNVFLDADDNVRLGDFGLCRQFRKAFTSYTDAGTDCYKSPETLLGGKRDGRLSDMWSLGLLLHEMCTKVLAWERGESLGARLLQRSTALDEIMRQVPPTYSPAFRRLMRRMLHPDPASRPTADDVLGMKLLRKQVRADARARQKLLHLQRRSAEAGMAVDGTPARRRRRRAGSLGSAQSAQTRLRASPPSSSVSGTAWVGTDTVASNGFGDAGATGSTPSEDESSALFFSLVDHIDDTSSDEELERRHQRLRAGVSAVVDPDSGSGIEASRPSVASWPRLSGAPAAPRRRRASTGSVGTPGGEDSGSGIAMAPGSPLAGTQHGPVAAVAVAATAATMAGGEWVRGGRRGRRRRVTRKGGRNLTRPHGTVAGLQMKASVVAPPS